MIFVRIFAPFSEVEITDLTEISFSFTTVADDLDSPIRIFKLH